MSLPSTTHAWVIQNYSEDHIDLTPNSPSSTFALKELPLPSTVPEDSILVRNLYLANDPAQRFWLKEPKPSEETAFRAQSLNTPMSVFAAISRVESIGGNDAPFKVGDLVRLSSAWSEYSVVTKESATPVPNAPGIKPTAWISVLGTSGITAYIGLEEILKIKPSDTLVVTGAAGSVGNVVVQYAKHVVGVKHVVGIAGSDEKCAWLKTIGADDAVNYKSKTFGQDLKRAAKGGFSMGFENVGGSVLSEVIANMKDHSTIALCGFVSTYNNQANNILPNTQLILTKSITLKGFTMFHHAPRFEEIRKALADAILANKIKVEGAETIVDVIGKFEEIPAVWNGLFEGKNLGKLITKISD